MENVRETKIEEVMTSHYYHLDPNDNIDKAAFIFLNNDIHSILLVDSKQRVKGVVKAVDVLSKLRISEIKLKTVAVNSPLLHQNTRDFVSIAKKMIASDLSLLPVVDKHEKVLGVVSIRALTRLLLETSPIQEEGIEEYYIEIPESETVSINDSVEKTVSLMKRYNTTDLVVMDENKITGIIRSKELFGDWNSRERIAGGPHAGSGEKKAIETTIENMVMDPVVLPLDGTKLIKDASDLMYQKNIGSVIFQDTDGNPKGKLTLRYLLRKIIESDDVTVSASDLVRVDGAPDDEIATICVKKAKSLYDKYSVAFGIPREAFVSLKKIQYQSKRGMFLWEVGIKMEFDKKTFHASATDFGTRKTANVAFVKLGRTLRDYRGRLYDRYQIGSRDASVIEETIQGTPEITVLNPPSTEIESAIRNRLSSFILTTSHELIVDELKDVITEFERLESTPESDDILWSCIIAFNFITESFTKSVMAEDPGKAFDAAFESISNEMKDKSD